MADTKTTSELREHLVSKASTDAEFRARLLADPTTAIKDELGLTIPDGYTLKVHEEEAGTGHLVLPPVAEDQQRTSAGAYNALSFWDEL